MFNRFLALDKKIGYTCKLLMQDNMSIAEVCHKSGFNNVSNFNRQFRKTYSMSPREYRAKM
jgi:AraC-like DNA-binding protein